MASTSARILHTTYMLPVAACELHHNALPVMRHNSMLSDVKLKSAAKREVRHMNAEQRAAFARLGQLLRTNVTDANHRPLSLSTIGGSVQAGSSLGFCTLKARSETLRTFGRGCSYAHQLALQLSSDCAGAADLEFA